MDFYRHVRNFSRAQLGRGRLQPEDLPNPADVDGYGYGRAMIWHGRAMAVVIAMALVMAKAMILAKHRAKALYL